MTDFEQFLSQAQRIWGRKIARAAGRRAAGRIWCERGPEAAAKFLRGFECFRPRKPSRPCVFLAGEPIGLSSDSSLSIGPPDEVRPKLEAWRREQAENGGE